MASTVRPRQSFGVEDRHEVLLRRRVDAGDRLVKEVQVRFRREGAREECAPALAARQRADLRSAVGCHANLLEGGSNGLPIASAGPPERPESRVAAHHRHVPDAHREAPVDELGLGHVGDPVRRGAGWTAEDRHRARPRAQHARDHLEQGRLAAAVGTEDRDEGARVDPERHVLQRGPSVIPDRDALAARRPVGLTARRLGGRARRDAVAMPGVVMRPAASPGSTGGPRTRGTARTAPADAR